MPSAHCLTLYRDFTACHQSPLKSSFIPYHTAAPAPASLGIYVVIRGRPFREGGCRGLGENYDAWCRFRMSLLSFWCRVCSLLTPDRLSFTVQHVCMFQAKEGRLLELVTTHGTISFLKCLNSWCVKGEYSPRTKPCSAIPSSPVEFLASLSLLILERPGTEPSPTPFQTPCSFSTS